MKFLRDIDFKNKVVLLRSDLNSDFVKGKIIESERIKEASKTINYLKKRKAKVIVLAHQGRPGKKNFTSLKQHAKFLNKYTKIKFIPSLLNKKTKKIIEKMKFGEAVLLENIRKEKDEFKPEKGKRNKLVKFFLPFVDVYVNDAFSVCHRKQASVVLLPKYFESCAGLLLEKEILSLKKIKGNCLYILGGSKPEDNIKLLGKNKVLACGIFGQMCVIARGRKLGEKNDGENRKIVENYDKMVKKLKKKLKKVETPEDFAVEVNGKRKEFPLDKFPQPYIIYDIGTKTIEKYVKEIKKVKAIFMKGPAGFASKRKFAKGTITLLKAIQKSKAFSVLGGGHLNDALKKYKISKKRFNHVSLSGGALLNFLAGEKLPGIEALEK